MNNQLISKALLSSVRDQLLSSAKQSCQNEKNGSQTQHSQDQKMNLDSPDLDTSSHMDLESEEHVPRLSLRSRLDSYPSADPLLDELLGDIRRSCGPSLASTPTAVSSDGDGRGDSVFECKLRRSRAELQSLDISELSSIVNTLSQEVDCVSTLLVKLLRTRDRHANKQAKQSKRLTLILKDYASRNGLNNELTFSLCPPASKDDYQLWLNAWKILSRLPKGIPKFWRKTMWSELTAQGTTHLDWDSVISMAFSEFTMPGDEALGTQIVKDLHRTGNTGFTTEQEHAVLKRVLLAYARFNSSTGYCQGFNVLAALILKVVDFDEYLALKVMVYLIDYILPENYFAQNLYALSADMAAFRDFLKHFLPELSSHLDHLQKEASGSVKKAYSFDNPPDLQSIHGYEPPLADVFTMQWFLTIFATSLPRKAVRMVWDLMFLEGSSVLIYTAVAILAVMERELLQAGTAADFYAVMAQFGERLRKAQLLPSTEFMQIVYAIQDSATSSDSTIPCISKLREKYTYNICPWAMPEDEDSQDVSRGKTRQCPPPSCGGSLSFGDLASQGSKNRKKDKTHSTEDTHSAKMGKTMSHFQDHYSNNTLKSKHSPIGAQMKLLKEHYAHTARQPQSIRCNLSLVPPQARVVCPQTKKAIISPNNGVLSYAADVPDTVLEKSKDLSGYSCMEELQEYKRKVFTISYCQPGSDGLGEPMQFGVEANGADSRHSYFSGFEKRRSKKLAKSHTKDEDLFIRYSTGTHLP